MADTVVLGGEAVALAAVHAGISAAYGYPGTPSTEILETILQTRRGRPARHVVQQREDGLRSGARRGARRPARPGHDEARRPERGGRSVRELRARLDARRPRRRRRRRPGHAQLAERTGQPLLRGLRARPLPRARHGAGGLRHDARRVRALGTLPRPGGRAARHAGGARTRRDRRASAPCGAADPEGRDARVLDPAARQCEASVARPARSPGRHAGVDRDRAVQHVDPRRRAARDRHSGHRTHVPGGESPRPRLPAVAAAHRRVPGARRSGSAARAACDPHPGARRRVPVPGASPARPCARRGRDSRARHGPPASGRRARSRRRARGARPAGARRPHGARAHAAVAAPAAVCRVPARRHVHGVEARAGRLPVPAS